MSTENLLDCILGSNSNYFLDWLLGNSTSDTRSFSDKADQHASTQEQNLKFPLAGREESLRHIASCFSTTYRHRYSRDRNDRRIPFCTGIPGLGKTRLLKECATTVLDMTRISGHRISGIVSAFTAISTRGRSTHSCHTKL